MSFNLGIFDIFAYTIPGAAYVAIVAYVGIRLQWTSLSNILSTSAVFVTIIGFGVSYVVGHLTYSVSRSMTAKLPGRWSSEAIRDEFVQRCPAAAGRRYINADPFLLLAAIEAKSMDLAADVSRIRTTGLMLRNLVLPLGLASLIALIEVRSDALIAIPVFALLVYSALSALQAGRERSKWAVWKTLEVAFWIEHIDDRLTT